MPTDGEVSEKISNVSRRRFLQTTSAGTAITTIAGCTGGGGDSNTVKVGAVYPLSGGLAELGQIMKTLIENAVEIVNTDQSQLDPLVLSGGEGLPNLDGATVEVTFADHRADPAQGRAEAERLVQEEDVDLLYGSFNSSVTKTVSQVAQREQVPHVNGESSSPTLTERGLDWFWRTGPHDRTYSENMFSFFDALHERDDYEVTDYAIIVEDTEYGSTSAKIQQNLIEERDWANLVMDPIKYTAETVTSLSSEVQLIRENDPDVLLPASYVKDAVLLMDEFKNIDYIPPIIMGQDTGYSSGELVNTPELSDFVCSRTDFTSNMPEVIPEIGNYTDYVTNNTDVNVGNFGGLIRTWGGILCALKGVDNAGSTEPEAVQEAMNNLSIPRLETGLVFPVEFAESGQNAKASGVLGQWEGASINLVWPFELLPGDLSEAFVYPAPTWSERDKSY